MTTKILTIGIPTYNNPTGIQNQLEYYLKQKKDNLESSELEVIVSDNSENDETKNIVAAFIPRIPELVYIKNIYNVGFDRNLDQVISVSKGNFCWTLSDDDILVEGAIEEVLSIIKENQNISCFIISKDRTKSPAKVTF